MKSKFRLFLFALGLSASYAYAAGDYNACVADCQVTYEACMESGKYMPSYCVPRLNSCVAWCDSWDGKGPIP